MYKRGNQFGYPSWKQLRQQDHPVLVHQRKNNKLNINKEKILEKKEDPNEFVRLKANDILTNLIVE